MGHHKHRRKSYIRNVTTSNINTKELEKEMTDVKDTGVANKETRTDVTSNNFHVGDKDATPKAAPVRYVTVKKQVAGGDGVDDTKEDIDTPTMANHDVDKSPITLGRNCFLAGLGYNQLVMNDYD